MDYLNSPQRLLLAILLLTASSMEAQNVAINNDGSPPDPSAILDISAKNKGILIPRIDSLVRKKMPNTIGLLVYDSTTRSFWYQNGKGWQNIATGSGWS